MGRGFTGRYMQMLAVMRNDCKCKVIGTMEKYGVRVNFN